MQELAESLKRYISSLDNDIASRIPWGETLINTDEGFVDGLPVTRFWTSTKDSFNENKDLWVENYNAKFVSKGDFLVYFTTNTLIDEEIIMEGAEEAYVCPSPASTLIMLQTRAKDLLKEVEAELSPIPTKTRKRDKFKKVFNKIIKK